MYKLVILLAASFLCCQSPYVQKGTENVVLFDTVANDSFEIRIDNYRQRDVKGSYDTIIFYFDASLKAGNYLRKFFNDSVHSNTLLVGIAHFGNYREKRRRDLMADNNHMNHLLDSGIVPYIQAHYGWADERIIVGHSFGGLWVYRDFFAADTLFTTFIAVSPSLWVEGTLMPSEYAKRRGKENLRTLYMYWGGGEEFNYVKGACHRAKKEIDADSMLRVKIPMRELKGETHNTTLTPAMESFFGR
ncbi:MAG: hypothetical protein F9K23_03710 [Bacteroidetes bacterium]|nr:MAG: hypothetical protein F9K23_03710 [Bacteroidota bacterium]